MKITDKQRLDWLQKNAVFDQSTDGPASNFHWQRFYAWIKQRDAGEGKPQNVRAAIDSAIRASKKSPRTRGGE